MKLAAIFTQGAVLQCYLPIRVWGETTPGAMVRCRLANVEAVGIGSTTGEFLLQLPPLAPGGPYVLECTDLATNETAQVEDVLIGEVWVASGQSNMEFTLCNTPEQCADFLQKIAGNDQIRMLTLPRRATGARECTFNAGWTKGTVPSEVESWSAVAAEFALKIHTELKVPVGILHSSWGGTIVEAWTSRNSVMAEPKERAAQAQYDLTFASPKRWSKITAADLEIGFSTPPMTFEPNATVPEVKENRGENENWMGLDYNDSDWVDFKLPGSWTGAKLAGNGVVWVRREVTIPPEWAGKSLLLKTGGIDKQDITYFNGVRIGSTGSGFDVQYWCTPRCYQIPAELVKAGRAVIAIRSFSFIYDGQFIGRANAYRLELPETDQQLEFSGKCKFKTEVDFGKIDGRVVAANSVQPEPGPFNQNSPSILFDSMIRPLIPYTIRGALWYQGESNAKTIASARKYQEQMARMIRDWRFHWELGDFPFYMVQLANYMAECEYNEDSIWPVLRESQRLAAQQTENTEMAVTIDVGEAADIHPKDKHTVGVRLATQALHHVYYQAVPAGSPLPREARPESGGKLRVTFDRADGGLVTRNGAALQGFYVADGSAEPTFYPAKAQIDGNSVVLTSAMVKHPVRVRYGWSDNPVVNLYNQSGFPASPFEL